MESISKNQILAASSGWTAAVLNVFPGLGVGYIYQRRWKAYWITVFTCFVLIFLGLSIQQGADPVDPAPVQSDFFGFWGVVGISAITSFEAAWAVKRSRNTAD